MIFRQYKRHFCANVFRGSRRSYYEILGITKDCSDKEIKAAYRSLALQHHPDRNGSNKEESERIFKEISEAYSILIDHHKRARYDNLDSVMYDRVSSPFGGVGYDHRPLTREESEALFEALFGRKPGARPREKTAAEEYFRKATLLLHRLFSRVF